MGNEVFEPVCAPNLSHFFLWWTCILESTQQKNMTKLLKSINCTLRILVHTTALGMGVNCTDIRKIFTGEFHRRLKSNSKRQAGQDQMEKWLK